MRCPVCQSGQTKVLDSRDGPDGEIRRRRSCSTCGHRFTTRERIDESLPIVLKRDGTRQPFDRDKLRRGLELACRKRPVQPVQLDDIVRALEQWAGTRGDREITAADIGERIMHHLHALDDVAYVRFVSVYRSFDTVAEFGQLLEDMEKAERVNVEGQRTLFDQPPSPKHEAAQAAAAVSTNSPGPRARSSRRGSRTRQG
ncbi:MAG: transcriptional repressor NrdR [Myxococcales bacterium FL481]|nr:MAG: transcriptional repressor NrdR [Myxococcales bacterium FL481]